MHGPNGQSCGTVDFLFESTPQQGWVGVVENSVLVDGLIASQNAGSSNKGIYYQVGGGGLNRRFATALGPEQTRDVNDELKAAYDALYESKGAWAADSAAVSPPADRLTGSLIVGLSSAQGSAVGSNVTAMMYSVGPVLDRRGITNEAIYQQIYYDAAARIASWNTELPAITALRITMLSTGIYADTVDDKQRLFDTAAKNIVLGLCRGISDCNLRGLRILINTNDSKLPRDSSGGDHVPVERPAFDAAGRALGFTVHASGFTVELAQLPARSPG